MGGVEFKRPSQPRGDSEKLPAVTTRPSQGSFQSHSLDGLFQTNKSNFEHQPTYNQSTTTSQSLPQAETKFSPPVKVSTHLDIKVKNISRDPVRWPDTAGFPPIRGGSGKNEEDKRKLQPVSDLAKQVGLSPVRIKALLKEEKIKGEMRREDRGPIKWYTSVEEVEEYRNNLWTPQEWGRKGNLIAGRGRPKKPPE